MKKPFRHVNNNFDMSGMIYECNRLETLGLGSFDLRKVESTEKMFARCDSLHTVIMKKRSDSTIARISKALSLTIIDKRIRR